MNTLITVLLVSLSFGRSVVPQRVVTPPLDLYNSKNKIRPDAQVEVAITTWSKRGEFIREGKKVVIPQETYEAFKKLAEPVLEMIPDQRQQTEAKDRRGTAFSIGNNLVITNHHVLDESFKNTTSCSDFELKDYKGRTFDCKKIHYCNSQHDFCLIEMRPITKRERSCFTCSATKRDIPLEGELKLKNNFTSSSPDEEVTTAIGNSAGLGIHLSQGRGLQLTEEWTYFYAPTTKGNSGGPLLNGQGEVIGVVKLQTKVLIHEDPLIAFNIAAPTHLMIKLIRNALENNPETLEKFNLSVIE